MVVGMTTVTKNNQLLFFKRSRTLTAETVHLEVGSWYTLIEMSFTLGRQCGPNFSYAASESIMESSVLTS